MSPSRPEFYKQDGQLDFDVIKKDYLSRCSEREREVMNMSVDEIMKLHGWRRGGGDAYTPANAPAKQPAKEAAPKAEYSSTVPIDKRIDIVVKYGEGQTTTQLGKTFDLNPITVRRILVAAGVYDPQRDKGRSPETRKRMRGDM